MSHKNFLLLIISVATLVSCRPIGVPSSMASIGEGDEKTILSGDRESGKIWQIGRNGWKKGSSFICKSIIDIQTDGESRVWALGIDKENKCRLYEIEYPQMRILKSLEMGQGADKITYDPASSRLWVSCSDINSVWEVSIPLWSVVGKIDAPRNIVGSVVYDSLVYMAGSLPEASATNAVVSAEIDVMDKRRSTLKKRIALPNGSVFCGDIVSNGKYAYVTHTINHHNLPTVRPERGWMAVTALSIVDMDSMRLEATVLLDTPEKGAGGARGMCVSPNGKELAVALFGTGEVMTINLDGLHARLDSVLNDEERVLRTEDDRPIHEDLSFLYGLRKKYGPLGKGTGEVLYLDDKTILAANLYSGDIMEVVPDSKIKRFKRIGRALTSTPEGAGEALFSDATLSFQNWVSCATCHGSDGGHDAMSHIISTDSTVSKQMTSIPSIAFREVYDSTSIKRGSLAAMALDRKTASVKKSKHKKSNRTVTVSGEEVCREAVRRLLFTEPDNDECRALSIYISSVSPKTSPYLKNGKLSQRAERGKRIFEDSGCAACHNGQKGSLEGLWQSAPYMKDGRVATLGELIERGHGLKDKVLNDKEKRDLEEYLLTL